MDDNDSDNVAAWVIGFYLIVHTFTFSYFSLIVWIASTWQEFFSLIPFIDNPSFEFPENKFMLFQKIIIAACSAGLGGGVFMIKSFYGKYAYGAELDDKDKNKDEKKKEYLKAKEIPRYVLLPMSSVILGPISLSLLKAGAITFSGLSGGGQVPIFTVVGVSFILGLTYHDTLHAFCSMSQTLFYQSREKPNNKKLSV